MNTWTGWDDDDEFAKRIRRELADAAGQVEPRRTLADLLERIRIRRPRRRRRIHKAARSAPGPETRPQTRMIPVAGPGVRHPAPAAAWPRCPCGRKSAADFCCWHCAVAYDGGWNLRPYSPGAPWFDTHTGGCELRQRALDPAWYAGTARPRGENRA